MIRTLTRLYAGMKVLIDGDIGALIPKFRLHPVSSLPELSDIGEGDQTPQVPHCEI